MTSSTKRPDEKDEANKADDYDVDVRCGYGGCKPEALQTCNNPKVLLAAMFVFTVSQGFVVNGINNVNTQSVERRFRLPSSRSGLVSSSYDFSAAVFGLAISFLGSGRYKARWLCAAAVIMSLGSLTMALPHFTTGLYEWGQDAARITCVNGTSAVDTCEGGELQNYLGVLMLGMILHGVGGCILYTVGVGLIDDSVDAISSPLYIGILYGGAALGPGLGYIVGGQLLNIYVDFDKTDTSTIDLTTEDPRWIGAWWVGFFITMTTFFLSGIPLSCYGAELPSAKRIRETRISQMHKGDEDTTHGHGTSKRLSIKLFPKITWTLLRNAPFVFTMLAGATEGILTSGFATFVPKYIQNHFGISSGSAAIYTGAAAVPGAAGGMFVGGLICNRMKLKVAGMFKFSIITCCITILLLNLLWISCDQKNFAGVSTSYTASGQSKSIADTCNEACGCSTKYFDPVCADDVQYFSACHAGCQNVSADGNTFSNCSCVSPGSAGNVTTATSGMCSSGCGLMYLFLVLFFMSIFCTFLPSTPSDAATLRCIHEDHRTYSLGLKWLFIRLLGTVPGPVLFGVVTDSACRVWQSECGENSSCWIYDNFAVSRNYFLVAISMKALSMLFFILAYCLYKPPDEAEAVKLNQRESVKKQMSFVNGSFRDSEFEGNVLEDSRSNPAIGDTTTRL